MAAPGGGGPAAAAAAPRAMVAEVVNLASSQGTSGEKPKESGHLESGGKSQRSDFPSHGSEGLGSTLPEGGKGTPRSVMSDQTDGQGPAPVDMNRGDRGVDIGCASDFDIGTEGENRMSLFCQTQMQSRLQDVRFYLSSRIRNGGI